MRPIPTEMPPTRLRMAELVPDPVRHVLTPEENAQAREAARAAQAEALAQNKARFVTFYKAAAGVLATACERAGIRRPTFLRWKATDPDFADLISEIDEEILDLVEGCLLKKIKDGDRPAMIFYLKTKGKKRGYVERQELTGANGAPLGGLTLNLEDLKQDFPPDSLPDMVQELENIKERQRAARERENE